MSIQQMFPSAPRTYKTRKGALKFLQFVTEGCDVNYPYVIATTEEGRYFPVVVAGRGRDYPMWLVHKGICTAG